MATAEDRKYLALWQQYKDNTTKATPVDLNETALEKMKRITALEKNDEAWFKYYFPNHYSSEPAPFQTQSTKRVMNTPEFFLVRSWSRELAKTSRTRMEVLKLMLTGKKKNLLFVADTFDDAKRLLLPYKVQLEANNRIINDYGEQQSINKWEAGEFLTKKGLSFRAIGAGQNPRGTNNDAVRPDTILVDDIDTDEECRNPDRIKKKMEWINEALYPTRSISEPLLWIANGNIIAKYCCITEMAKKADLHEVVNIRDAEGKSTWPQKNSEKLIDRALKPIPWSSQQKEYYNNPISEGDTFKTITYGACPKLASCEQVIVYADPSTSNKDRGKNKQASYKCVVIVGSLGRKRYVYKVWLNQTSNAKFVSWLYEAYLYLKDHKVDTKRIHIENNSLQDPFYQQVILPLIYVQGDNYGFTIPITEDARKKPDKFFRIEGTLEPLNRLGNLIFNKKEKEEPNMVRLHEQMIGVSEKATVMDGPDALEGACWLIQDRAVQKTSGYLFGSINSRKF